MSDWGTCFNKFQLYEEIVSKPVILTADNPSRTKIVESKNSRSLLWLTCKCRFHYQQDEARRAVWILTIHALVHISDEILNARPVWALWEWVTEPIARCVDTRTLPFPEPQPNWDEIWSGDVVFEHLSAPVFNFCYQHHFNAIQVQVHFLGGQPKRLASKSYL